METTETTETKAPETRLSTSGTNITGNRIYEEYLGLLKTSKLNYDVFDKMRRSDSQVKRTLRALMAPILTGKFTYNITDTTDQEQIKQATYKNKFYNDNQMFTWVSTLTEILTMLPMGYSLFEPTFWSVDDPELGKIITLRNLGFIKQKTVSEWTVVDNSIVDVRQIAITPDGKSIDVKIPGEGLVVFVNEREGDNFEGVSVLRAAYGNYIRKDLFYKIDMIGIEKMAIGTPVWYAPKSVLDVPTELSKLIDIAENYVGHEQAFLILDNIFKDGGFEVIEGKYNADAVNQAIKREDGAIVDSVLASFLNIGTQRAGGNAQNAGHQGLFLSSLLSIATEISDILDTLAHKYYVLNFGEPKTRIRMSVDGITMDDAEKAMTVLRGYVTAGVIKADDKLETYVRSKINLPEADIATARDFKGTPDYKADQTKQDADNPEAQANPEVISE